MSAKVVSVGVRLECGFRVPLGFPGDRLCRRPAALWIRKTDPVETFIGPACNRCVRLRLREAGAFARPGVSYRESSFEEFILWMVLGS